MSGWNQLFPHGTPPQAGEAQQDWLDRHRSRESARARAAERAGIHIERRCPRVGCEFNERPATPPGVGFDGGVFNTHNHQPFRCRFCQQMFAQSSEYVHVMFHCLGAVTCDQPDCDRVYFAQSGYDHRHKQFCAQEFREDIQRQRNVENSAAYRRRMSVNVCGYRF